MRSEIDALATYLELRVTICSLEARENECTCDANEFHTCALCTQSQEVQSAMRRLLSTWGDYWALTLGRYVAKEKE